MRQLRGFLPWIVYPIAAALVDWRIAAAGALAVAVGALLAGGRSAETNMFGVAAVVFFAALTGLALVDPTSDLHRFVGALTPAALAVAALVSIAIGRPFTIPFAKRVAPREFWDTPVFMRINVVLSAVWATSFAAMAAVIALVLALHPEAGGIIVVAQIAGFVIPMRICRSYPASVRARARGLIAEPAVTTELTRPFHLDGNYAPVTREVTVNDLPFEGRIPEALSGCYVRNGPNPKRGGGSTHWFYGDGMVHGVELAEGRARWYRNRWVRTSTFTDDARVVRPDFTVDRRAGVANTNVIQHGGRMLALVETSFPYELTDTLETVGPCDFDGRLTTAMTAHPKICPSTGELHFFGYGLQPPYLTYHCADAAGRLVRSHPIDVAGPTMVHDFAITATQVVFLDLPVVFDPANAVSGMPFRWDDNYGARIGLLPRSAPNAPVNWYEIEPCYVFHVLNAYDAAGDAVVLDALRYPELWRDGSNNFGASRLHRWTIETGKQVHEQPLDEHIAEFPRIDDRRTGLQHRFGYAIHHTEPLTGAILRYDLTTGTTARITVGEGRVPSEAVFVPARADASEHEGYLIAYVYDASRDASDLVILPADEPAAPPLATVQLPQRVPFGFHGNWIPHHSSSRTAGFADVP